MSSRKVVCYSLNGCQGRRITNLALLEVDQSPDAGVWLNLQNGSSLRTFSSELLCKYNCRATGERVNWADVSDAGKAKTIIKWDNVDYDTISMDIRRNISDNIKAQLSPSQRNMLHSLVLSRGSLLATMVWKTDVRRFELQILDTEIRDSLDFAAISDASLGRPTMTSVISDDEPVATSPTGAQTEAPNFDNTQRVS